MWTSVEERKHTVTKVFPARFQDASAAADGDGPGAVECEVMLFGEVDLKTRDGEALVTPWAGHAVVKRETVGERPEWKMSHYRVWLQS